MVPAAGPHTIEGAHGRLHFHVWPGEGPPVVAIHGVDGSHRSWQSIAEALGDARTLVALDLRGRGESSHEGPFGVSAHAADVKRVIDVIEATDGDGVDLVGHSFGCHVAARVAVLHPAAVRSLVLVDGGPPRVIPDGTSGEEIVEGALANIVPNLAGLEHPVAVEAVEADFASMVLESDASHALFEVDAPVHLLRAELGVAPGLPPVVPDSVVADLVRAGVELTDVVVAGATHFSILDAADVVAALRPD